MSMLMEMLRSQFYEIVDENIDKMSMLMDISGTIINTKTSYKIKISK